MRLVRIGTWVVSVAVMWAQSSAPTYAEGQLIKLNGGLEAEILALGRDKSRQHVTVSLKLSNAGQNIAFLALSFDPAPVANSNTGGHYVISMQSVSGIAKCGNVPAAECMGSGAPIHALPFQSWTELDPGTNTVINMVLFGGGNTGPLMSFSASVLYRLESDTVKDDTLSESQKRQQVRSMSLSFGPTLVVDEP